MEGLTLERGVIVLTEEGVLEHVPETEREEVQVMPTMVTRDIRAYVV